MQIEPGFAEAERAQIAGLYWQAFGAKLGRTLGPDEKAIAFVTDLLDPTHAICARGPEGTLLGVAGFKTAKGALVDGAFGDLRRHYGVMGAIWRAGLLTLLERDVENARFLMDGIFVDPSARGQGVGTALLEAIVAEAKKRGYPEVRLDVIDSNPRARALYERFGFKAADTHQLGPLRWVFGFRSATTMVRAV